MKTPTKVPTAYVTRCLREFLHRGIDFAELEGTVPGTIALASVAKIKSSFFKRGEGFQEFKERYLQDIDDVDWQQAAEEDPNVARYCRRWMKEKPQSPPASPRGRPKKRKNMRLVNLFSEMSDDDDDYPDQHVFTFPDAADDDPNLPMPVCRGIRRSCRNYGSGNRYVPFDKDESENNEYLFDVSY